MTGRLVKRSFAVFAGFAFLAISASLMSVLGRAAASAASPVTFTDVSAAAGIRFVHNNGAFGGKYLPETLGSGCAFVDVDGDGWQDIFFVNSKSWPGHGKAPSYPALYRNNHDGTFTDITRQSGLAVEMYGLGVAAADFDNDGRIDLYVTALESNHLFRNVGGGNGADFFQRRRVIPRVIVKLDPRVGRAAFGRGNFQPPADRLFAHRRMCAESDEHVERAGHRSDLPVKRLKQKPDRRGARSIRHYKQDLFAAILLRRAGLGQNISHLFGAQGAARRGRL